MGVAGDIQAVASAGDAVRDRLLSSAAELFADRGFDGVSVREICVAAGVTKPTLYYYFGSKNRLAATIVAEASGHVVETVGEVVAGPGTVFGKLSRVARAIFERSSAAPKTSRFFFASVFAPREAAPWFDYDAVIPKIMALTARVFEEGVRTGETPGVDPEFETMVLLGTVQAYAMRFVRRGDVHLTAELAERIVERLLRGPGVRAMKGEMT